jgi:EmrB/QacA subfamily drug resistance transporter
MAIIVATFPAQRRGTALGVWGAVAGLATVAGPTLGGLLVTVADWRWIFFVNVPIGVAVLVLTFGVIPDTRIERQHRMDILGVVIATAALFCLTFALIEGQRFSWDTWIWALLAASAVLTIVFLVQQRTRQSSEPLVPFSLFRDRNFSVISIVACLVSVGILGFFLPMTIYLQTVLGYSALKAGLVLAPMSIVSIFIAPVAGRLTDRVGGKYLLMAGLAFFTVGGAWLAFPAQVDSNWPAFLPAILVMGVGFGFIFAPMATEAMRSVPPHLAGAAAGVNNTIRQVGSVIGSAAVGALLQAQLASKLHEEALSRSAQLPAGLRSQFVAAFNGSGKGALELGGGSTRSVPSGLPSQVAQQLQQIGAEVFRFGFVRAMHPTMVLPIVAMAIASLSCFLVQRHVGAAADSRAAAASSQPPASASAPAAAPASVEQA